MKKILAALLIVLLVTPAWAAVTVDSTNSGEGADPLSVSRTIAVGATLDVLLCAADDALAFVTGVTRSTDTYTELTTARASDGTTGISTTIFYKTNPLSGTANAVAAVSGSTEGLGCWGISFTGSDTSTPFSGQTGVMDATADDATESNSVTAVAGEIVIDVIGLRQETATGLTAGASQTDIVSVEATGQGHGYGGSWQAGADGGVMSWSWTTNMETAHSIAVVKAAGAASARRPIIIVQ